MAGKNSAMVVPVIATASYGFISLAITFFNKAVLSVYQFKCPNIMTLGQMIVGTIIIQVGKNLGYLQCDDFELEKAKKVTPLSLSFLLYVVTGLAALQFLNVPMFSALRRIATVCTMVAEFYVLNKVESRDVQIAVGVMVGGSFVAGISDMTFSLPGYILAGLNCVFTALYLVVMNKVKKETNLSTYTMMLYNNMICIPFVLVIALLTGEFAVMNAFEYANDTGFLVSFFISCVQAFLLNVSIFWANQVTSALTVSVTGQVKNLLQTTIGLFIFGDVIFNFTNLSGLFISSVGSVWYTYLKFQQSSASKGKATESKNADSKQSDAEEGRPMVAADE